MKKQILPTWILCLLIVSLLAAACAPAAATAQPQPGAPQPAETAPGEEAPQPGDSTDAPEPAAAESEQVLTRAITSEPSGLDPQGPAAAGQNVVLPYLYDTLIYADIDNNLRPYLAESWEMAPDGLSATFILRENITFHDGTPLDAAAVQFTFERLREQGERSMLAGMIANIESIEAVDERTVMFHFRQPSSTFLSSVANIYAGIVSPAAVEQAGENFPMSPVGSGAYMLERWDPGVAITLVKNPNYAWPPAMVENQGPPRPDRLVFKIIPDVSQQISALEAGEVDVLFVNQTSHIARLEQNPEVELVETTLNSLIYLGFNLERAPFDDLRLRQAFSHAVNKAELVETALGGVGEPAFAPLAPTLPGFDPSLQEYELGFDLEKTAQLLTEAGYTRDASGAWSKDGRPLTARLLTSTRPPNQALATVLQSQFKAAGVQVEVVQLDATAVQEALAQGDYDLMLWRYDWNDADVLRVYLSSARIGRTNRNNYSNPQVDALLEQAAAELDDAARDALYLEAQQLILQDAPWQPLYTPKDYMAIRKDVTGVVMGPMGRMLVNDVVKE